MIIKIEMSHKIPIPMTLCSTIYSKSSAMEFRRFMAFSYSGKLPVEKLLLPVLALHFRFNPLEGAIQTESKVRQKSRMFHFQSCNYES